MRADWAGLWVVTVANGQTQITAPNIVQATNVPILPADLLHGIQANSPITAADTDSANTYVISLSPAATALTDGMVVWFKAKTANTGVSTQSVIGLGASPLVGCAHLALRGGEIVVSGKCQAVWRADISSWVLIECPGELFRLLRARKGHAINLGQFTGANQSLASNGYQKFPGGSIIHWGVVTTNGSGTATNGFSVVGLADGVATLASCPLFTTSSASINVVTSNTVAALSSAVVRCIAIGNLRWRPMTSYFSASADDGKGGFFDDEINPREQIPVTQLRSHSTVMQN